MTARPTIDRRTLIAGAGALATPAARAAPRSRVSAVELRTAGLRDPLGIDDPRPTLAWQLRGPDGTMQRAWQVRVARDRAALTAGRADLWDSGRVEGGDTAIGYAGAALASRQTCHWQVRVWAEDGAASAWSAPARWEMGLLAASDWAGDWLAAESAEERDDRLVAPRWFGGPSDAAAPLTLFRLRFDSAAGAARLALHVEGRLRQVTLDGAAVTLPSQATGYGEPPAVSLALPLAAGAHELIVGVAPRGQGSAASAALAAQLRLPRDGTTVRRIVDGWEWRRAARWVPAPASDAGRGHFPWPPTPARLFRRDLTLPAVPRRARVYVAALGGYRLWINGRRVGDDELQSEPSEYRRHIPYRSYDVTALLRAGANTIAAIVGDGFYASYQAPDGRWAYGPAPRRLRLMLEADGTGVATDTDWRHATAPITVSEIYTGEDHDRRAWPNGWDSPGFDDRAWDRAWTAPAPTAALVAPLAPPIRATRTLRAASIRRLGARAHLIDFGQNFAGRVRLRLSGARGDAVVVRHAEILTADGGLDRRNLRVARAEDHYVLAGGGEELLEPVFTYQGFRYAQVDGPAELTPAMVEGVVIASDLPEIGTFAIDVPLIQKLWLNTLWSQRSNFRGNPTDCPQRDERLGWTGDAQVFWDTAAFNMDVGGFTRSFTRMLRDDQAANGAFPMWSPAPQGLGWSTDTATPGWADAGVMLPYVAYLHGGDRAVVDDNWAAMRAYLAGIVAANPDGLWREGRGADLGDWLALDAKEPGDETTPKDLIATAMLARSLDQMATMAGWTGREDEAAVWRRHAATTRAAFARAFVGADGRVGNGSHSSYILALRLGLVPAERRAAAGERLVAAVRARGTLLTTGFLGTPLALDALADVGATGLVYDLLLRTAYPSWGYMVARGATTTWERWNADVGDPSMNSFNHYAFGAVCSFLYRRVAGVEPLAPGFRRFRVAPLLDPRVPSARVALNSAAGPIRCEWRQESGRTVYELEVPANAECELVMKGGRRVVRPGYHRWVT